MINAFLFLPSEEIPEGEHKLQFVNIEKSDKDYIAVFTSPEYGGVYKYYFFSPFDSSPVGGMSLEESIAYKERSNLAAITELAVAILGKKEMFSYKAPSYDTYFEGLINKLKAYEGTEVLVRFTASNNKTYIARKKWIRPLEQ